MDGRVEWMDNWIGSILEWMGGWTDGRIDGWKKASAGSTKIDGCIHGLIDERAIGLIEGWQSGWMGGRWTDRWTDRWKLTKGRWTDGWMKPRMDGGMVGGWMDGMGG